MYARLQRAAVATLAGALAVSALTATAAFAQTKAVTGENAKTTPSLTSLEKTLKTLEVSPGNTPLTENGSSLFYPLFAKWALNYPYASSISLTTGNAGSGTGISDAIAGTINIGTSDAYLPASDTTVINIPEVISAQMIDYNIPGLSKSVHLKLDSTVINDMYEGTITNWNSSQITSLNPGVKIPSTPIVTLHRSDSSGDTFLFSSYLVTGDSQSFLRSSGPNTLVSFPNIPGAIAAKGNTGMLQECAVTPGCIAYIGISYENSATSSGLGIAQLKNAAGKYLLPSTASIEAEVGAMKSMPANGAVSLVYLPKVPKGYPIVNFEYAVVAKSQPSGSVAKAIQSLLAWGMDPKGGASPSELASVHFQSMPANAMAVAVNLLKSL